MTKEDLNWEELVKQNPDEEMSKSLFELMQHIVDYGEHTFIDGIKGLRDKLEKAPMSLNLPKRRNYLEIVGIEKAKMELIGGLFNPVYGVNESMSYYLEGHAALVRLARARRDKFGIDDITPLTLVALSDLRERVDRYMNENDVEQVVFNFDSF